MTTIKPKTMEYYDLVEILEAMENNGYMSMKKFWKDYMTWGVENHSIFFLGFRKYDFVKVKNANEFRKYFIEVNKLLGLDENNGGIMVKVSW